MTALVWGEPGTKKYEYGLSKGVLYPQEGPAVPWNGLTEVTLSQEDSVTPVHFDGRKINDIVTIGDLKGGIKAYTFPEEFLDIEGTYEDSPGVFYTGQQKHRFGLSYQSRISTDTEENAGIKIHALYNLTAVPSATTYETLSLDVDPQEFEWEITAIPETIAGYRPTAHVIFDSRQIDPWLFADIQAVLYGDDILDASLPSLTELGSFIRKWERLTIVDNDDGTWTAISARDDQITMVGPDQFEIPDANAVFTDPPTNETFDISSSERNEEDL